MNSGPHSARSTGANRQRRSLSRRPTSSTPIGISVPPLAQVADEADQPAGLHRLEPEHDDVGEADVGREPDRVRVAGARRIAGRVGRRPARWRSRPSRSSSRSSRRAGCGSRAAPRLPTVPGGTGGTVSAGSMYRFLLSPKLAGVPPPRHRRDRDDGEPRVLAAAPPRRAPGAQRRRGQPGRPAAGAARRRARDRCRPGRRSSGGRSRRRGPYLPDEQLIVVNRSQNGLAGEIVVTPLQLDDGRILLVSRGFVPLEPADRRRRRPARSRSPAGCSRRSERTHGRAQRPGDGRPGRGPARRHRAPRPAAARRGRADVRRADVVGPAGGRAVPAAADAPRARPTARTCPTPCSGSSSPPAVAVGWVLAVRKSSGPARPRHDEQPPPQPPAAVDATAPSSSGMTSRGAASMRRYGAQTSTGSSKNESKNVASASWSRREQHLAGRSRGGGGCAAAGAATRRPTPTRGHAPAPAAAAASAAATRGAARSEAATEKPVAGWV